MKTFKRTITFLIVFFLSFSVFANNKNKMAQNRKLFLKTEAALQKKDRYLLVKYRKQLESYPLYPYLLYTDYNNRLGSITKNQIKSFSKKYGDTFLATQLKQAWLKQQAKKRNWGNFLDIYSPTNNQELNCYHLNARLHQEGDVRLFENVDKLWLVGKSQHKACDPLFNAWKKAGHMTSSKLWKRIELAIDNKNYSLAKYLAKKLSSKDRKFVDFWIKLEKKPSLAKKRLFNKFKHRKMKNIIHKSIIKIAKSDPSEAKKLWSIYNEKYKFPTSHTNSFIRTMAISLANKDHPRTLRWLAKIPARYSNEIVYDAKLKYRLKNNDWKNLLKDINSIPEKIAQKNKWMYWKAVGLQFNGKKADAQTIFNTLSKERNYYGFLASFRLLKPYSFKNNELIVDNKTMTKVLKVPAIKRAIELIHLDRNQYANREWYNAMAKMNEAEKQAAAKIASKLKVPNWSIMALARAKNKDDLNLRFPVKYSKYIFKEADKNEIDPAWIFAITRQESAFMPTATSSAGAKGLMQLMPATGKMVAKKVKVPYRSSRDLFKVDKNIKLGSKYLQMMLKRYNNNHVLATAAYNAGPSRIDRWLPTHNMEADAWIETIPFRETRNYVQNVMTYTIIYQMLLGNHPEIRKKSGYKVAKIR